LLADAAPSSAVEEEEEVDAERAYGSAIASLALKAVARLALDALSRA